MTNKAFNEFEQINKIMDHPLDNNQSDMDNSPNIKLIPTFVQQTNSKVFAKEWKFNTYEKSQKRIGIKI